MKYKVVFTDIHRHMDYISEASDRILIDVIKDTLKDGKLMLSELTEITDENA